MSMAWHAIHHSHLVPTSSKSLHQHVLELPLATLRHPKSTPLLQAPHPARNRRCPAGQPHVKHLACTPCPGPPWPTSTRPRRARPPARAHATPLPPRHGPLPFPARTSPPQLVPVPHAAWPRLSRAPPRTRAPPPIKGHPWPPPLTTPPPQLPLPPRCSRGAAGARPRAARPPGRDAAAVRLRRRHRHLGAAPTTLPRPQATPESLVAGRCLP